MSEHKRIYNLLQIISLLSKPGGYSVQRLARRFDLSTRTIYRYLVTLRSCGFKLARVNGRYRFENREDSVNLLPLFTSDEETVIRKAVQSLHDTHPNKSGLLEKLGLMADPGYIAEFIVDAKTAGNVQKLAEAIQDRCRVILHDYHSLNSEPVECRMVDPIGFSVNMKYVYGFDPAHQKVVQFKPERIGAVEITDTKFIPDERYRVEKPDLFGMSGSPETEVQLRLNRRAVQLLAEEFPESRTLDEMLALDEKGLSEPEKSGIRLSLPVKGFEGVGRFVLGLPGEAEPLGPVEFLQYLQKRRGAGMMARQGKRKMKMHS